MLSFQIATVLAYSWNCTANAWWHTLFLTLSSMTCYLVNMNRVVAGEVIRTWCLSRTGWRLQDYCTKWQEEIKSCSVCCLSIHNGEKKPSIIHWILLQLKYFTLKKLKEHVEQLLQLGHSVYQYRCDIFSFYYIAYFMIEKWFEQQNLSKIKYSHLFWYAISFFSVWFQNCSLRCILKAVEWKRSNWK